MKSVRFFDGLAKSNVICGALCGALCGAAALGGFIAALASESRSRGFAGMAVFVISGLMAGSLVHSANRHLRRPSRESTAAIASNTTFFLWFVLAAIFGFSPLRDFVGSGHTLVGPGVALIVYCVILKPVATRVRLPHDPKDSILGHTFHGIVLFGKVVAILGLILFWMWTSIFGPTWPGITEPAKLRHEATLLCRSESGDVPRERWPEGIAALNPRDVFANSERVNVRLSGGGMSGRPWGFFIWPDTVQRSDRGITRYDSNVED